MMTIVTEDRIDSILREALTDHGVLGEVKDIDVFVSPDGVLAEVLLQDASALERARQAVDSAARRLEGDGVWLLPTIRALWQIEEVQKVEVQSPPGAPPDLAVALFRATLKSGTRRQEVWVAVTPSAQQVLRPLTTSNESWLGLIRAFLGHRLSIGGAGHWDPIQQEKVELGESESRYLRWRPYEQLKSSIQLVLGSPKRAKGFLRALELAGGNARSFDDALKGLPGPGGSIARGERVPTSNHELYEMLLELEKDDLRQYYFRELERASTEWPELTAEFSHVLAA
jgi:hypothetical protein